MIRLCTVGCGAELGSKNKSGVCRPCAARRFNADPAQKERRLAGLRQHFQKPGVREANGKRLKEWVAKMPPEHREMLREHGRRQAAVYLHSPEVVARANSSDARARAGAARTETVLSWCPAEYRDRYRDLTRRKLASAEEAKRMILDEIAAVERRRLASMSSFERQMERVRAGASISIKQPLRRADPAFTLGGVATGALS